MVSPGSGFRSVVVNLEYSSQEVGCVFEIRTMNYYHQVNAIEIASAQEAACQVCFFVGRGSEFVANWA